MSLGTTGHTALLRRAVGRSLTPVAATLIAALVVINPVRAAETLADPLEIRDHVLEGSFSKADEALSAAERAHREGQVSDREVARRYGVFRTDHDDIGVRLDDWVAHEGASHRAHMARAQHRLMWAWLARGTKWTSDTEQSAFEQTYTHVQDAVEDLEIVLERDPSQTVAYANLIEILRLGGDIDRAMNVARRGLGHDRASHAIHSAVLSILQPRWGGSQEAVEIWLEDMRPLMDEHPDLARFRGYQHYVRGRGYKAGGHHEEALAELEKAVAAGYKRSGAWVSISDLHVQMGDPDAGFDAIERAVELADYPGTAHTRLAVFLRERDQLAAALAELEPVIARNPQFTAARTERGYIYELQERWQDAVTEYRAARRYGKRGPTLEHRIAGILASRLDQAEKAQDHARRAVEMAPEEPDYHFALLNITYQLDNCEAITPMEDYLDLCTSATSCRDGRKIEVEGMLSNTRAKC